MSFLEQLEPDARERLMNAGEVKRLEPGDYLLRRGEKGGDVFFVESGTFDVVDTRTVPEVILQVVGAGALLGEVAFLTGEVRAADIRCTATAGVRVWTKGRLEQTLQGDLALERSFYRSMAQVTTRRLRGMVNLGGSDNRVRMGEGIEAEKEAQSVASEVLSVWAELDTRLRVASTEPESKEAIYRETQSAISRAFDKLQERARHWLGGIQGSRERFLAGEALCRTVQPFLQQAHLCEFALDSVQLDAGRRVPRAHIIRNQCTGHGALGELLDAVLLELPTSRAIRSNFNALTAEVEAGVPSDSEAQIALLGVGSGALLADLSIRLARSGVTIQLVDGDSQVLESVDMGMSVRPRNTHLNMMRIDLGMLAMGRLSLPFGPQHVTVVDGLASHLPDRLLAGLLKQLHEQVGSGGRLLLTALGPSRDSVVFDHLLRWPMIRRSPRQISGLIEAAGFRSESVKNNDDASDCAQLFRIFRD